jgi:hypothetical protein
MLERYRQQPVTLPTGNSSRSGCIVMHLKEAIASNAIAKIHTLTLYIFGGKYCAMMIPSNPSKNIKRHIPC